MTSKKTLLQDGDVFQENETLVFDPYNRNNREITKEQVHKILSDYGIKDKIHNLNLYKRYYCFYNLLFSFNVKFFINRPNYNSRR